MNLVAQAKGRLPSPIKDTLRPLYWKMYAWKMYAKRYIPESGIFTSVLIETFPYCNRKCSFCFNNDRFPERELGIMSTGVWEKIIEELSSIDFAGKIFTHGYGEPLLDKRLPELISFARGKCPYAEIMFASNGDFLTEELLSELIRKGLDHVLITNYDDFEKSNLAELCEKYPAHVVYRSCKEMRLQNKAGVLLNRKNIHHNTPCLQPFTELVIDWKGNIVLCCNDYYEKHVLGNVKDESILEVWYSDKFNEYRRILKRGNRAKIDICKNCDVRVSDWPPPGFGGLFHKVIR